MGYLGFTEVHKSNREFSALEALDLEDLRFNTGAGNGIRTRDPRLGKAMLYR